VRGIVTIVGLSDGPLSWPIGDLDGVRDFIVYRGLAKALGVEQARSGCRSMGRAGRDGEAMAGGAKGHS
jgi:hypothetical protein